MKKVIALLLAIVLALSLIFSIVSTTVGAENSATIRGRINSLESQADVIAGKKAALKKELDANKSKSQTTIDKKSSIDKQIDITRQEIQNANDQVQEYNLLIADTQKQLDAGLREQEDLNVKYKLRIRAMEEKGSVSYWSILFKARSFSDLIDRMAIIREIAVADQLMMKQIRENNAAIVTLRDEIETERGELQEKVEEMEALQQTLKKQKEEAEELIKTLASEQAELAGNYAAIEAEEDAVRQKIIAEQAKYEKALSEEQRNNLSSANQGNAAGGGTGFRSPLPRGSAFVTDAYGYRVHPIYGYYSLHGGVDLAANLGTPVYAIASGYVSVATYHSVNGNYVSLSHGNGYGSLYAHLDYFTVSTGAYVGAGDIIGYVGTSGWSTGPHLHFEIHKNGSTVNPMNYISLN